MKKTLFSIALVSCLLSCNSDEYSPNQVFNRNTPKESNAKEMANLPNKVAGSPIKIIVSGDTQRSYEDSKDFVTEINKRTDIDFVFLNGDISDFGLLAEFEGIHDIYSRLNVPFIGVIGNHDLVANGRAIYERMFGPRNFTFTYAGIKFVCHDTNGREFDFDGTTPDMDWLKNNLKLDASSINLIAVGHVPPNDGDFDPAVAKPYQDLCNSTPGVLGGIYSHQHAKLNYYYQNGTGIPFIITNAIVKRAYTIVDIKNGTITAQEINY